jgi:filamin
MHILSIRPVETGRHLLTITFNDEHVPGSPFVVKVSSPSDPSKVQVQGPGIANGIITNFQGRFVVNTQGAGSGELTVKVRGPKGAFLVEMQRDSPKDRIIRCRYNPEEPGIYVIELKWSGEHIPRSPIKVYIAENANDLMKYEAQSSTSLHRRAGPNAANGSGDFYNDDYN